jgi:hypothetical protein
MFSIGQQRTEKRFFGDQSIDVERRPTVRFNHEKHLNIQHRLEDTEHEIQQLSTRLGGAIPAQAFEKIQAASVSVKPAAERDQTMRSLLASLGLGKHEVESLKLMRLEHSLTRLKQLAGFNCAGCHTYDATGSHHLTVERQACFTCHFNNQAFNTDTGECLKCHEPPSRRIAIHATATAQGPSATMMDHRDIVARGINCVSCHRDVVQGESSVTARECTHCHDQSQFLKDFATRDTHTVAEYHRTHVAAQRARCSDCHRSVEHHLIDASQVASSAGLLRPVVDDCQHCHPGHHHEQVELLMGVGGAGIERPMPNAMFGSRANCQACHTKTAVDKKGDELVKATEASCIACHGNDYQKLFKQWLSEIQSSLSETEKTLARVEERIAQLKAQNQPIPPRISEIVSQARQNIQLVRSGNGIHNKGYALQLLETSTRALDEAVMIMAPKS